MLTPVPTTKSTIKSTTKPAADCSTVKVSGTVASLYELDCVYTTTSFMFNNYPVYECQRANAVKKLYLRQDGHLALHTKLEDGNGPLIWISRSSDTLCPSDNNGPFGYWNLDKNDFDVALTSEVAWDAQAIVPISRASTGKARSLKNDQIQMKLLLSGKLTP